MPIEGNYCPECGEPRYYSNGRGRRIDHNIPCVYCRFLGLERPFRELSIDSPLREGVIQQFTLEQYLTSLNPA